MSGSGFAFMLLVFLINPFLHILDSRADAECCSENVYEAMAPGVTDILLALRIPRTSIWVRVA